jgi:hypothetical protein
VDLEPWAAVLAAFVALVAGLLTALYTKHQDRRQHARVVLLAPAELFAETASTALASLRYVTPPSLSGEGPRGHRNARLLLDTETRRRRLEACGEAIDAVRRARARVRVVFHPDSTAAEHTRETLQQLRACLDVAEGYYVEHDRHRSRDLLDWRSGRGAVARRAYKSHRRAAYEALDLFYDDTARRLRRPTRSIRRKSPAASPHFWETVAVRAIEDRRADGKAVVRARSVDEAELKLRAAGLDGFAVTSIQRSSSSDEDFWASTPLTSGLAVAFMAEGGTEWVLWLEVPLNFDTADDLHLIGGAPPKQRPSAEP